MEHCFTGAICLILFLGLIQAKSISMNDLDRDLNLLRSVSCENNVTFNSPINVKKHCSSAAYDCIMKELEKAKTNCTDKEVIGSTLETLEATVSSQKLIQSVGTNTPDCKWENPKTLDKFVADIESFVQLLNSMNSILHLANN